jgi:hypothetical protein
MRTMNTLRCCGGMPNYRCISGKNSFSLGEGPGPGVAVGPGVGLGPGVGGGALTPGPQISPLQSVGSLPTAPAAGCPNTVRNCTPSTLSVPPPPVVALRGMLSPAAKISPTNNKPASRPISAR